MTSGTYFRIPAQARQTNVTTYAMEAGVEVNRAKQEAQLLGTAISSVQKPAQSGDCIRKFTAVCTAVSVTGC